MGEFSSIFQITLKSFIRQRYFVVQFLISFSLALLYIIIFSLFVQPLLRTVFDTDTTEVMQNSSQLLRGNYGIVYSDPKQHSFTALHPNANVLSATSTSTDTIIISMTQSSSQYGISLDDLGSIVVTKQQNQVILPVIQALNLDFHNIRIGRLPHQSLKLAQSLTPFSALLTIFFTVLDYMLTLFLDQYQKSKLEGRTQFILLNGASKAKWHTYHLVLVAGAMFVFMCVIMTILSVIGAQFARVNVLIWAIVGLLYYFQSGAILLLLGKYSQTITGYYQLGQYVSLLQTISLMVLMFQSTKINQGLLVLLQLMPQVALNNVILAMFYAGYNHDNKSLEFIYENFNLYYTIIIQLIEIAVFLAIVIFTDPSTVRRATNQCVAVSEEVLESQFSDTILKHVRLANQQVQENNFQDGILIYGVSKSYGNTLANKEITMQIRKNSIFGLIGENGSGKTTLCKSIIRAHKIDLGEIFVDGQKLIDSKCTFGVCSQENKSLFDFLNADEHIKIYRSLFKIKIQQPDGIDLNIPQNQNTLTFSGGQKRLLQLEIALVNDPDYLILDEPTAGIDPKGRKKIWNYIKSLQKTIICTSHLPDELTYFDEICLLSGGEVKLIGDVDSICGGLLSVERDGQCSILRAEPEGLFSQLLDEKQRGIIKEFSLKSCGLEWVLSQCEEKSILE